VRETALQTPRSVKKEGEEVLQVAEQIPLQPLVKTIVKQTAPLQTTVDHVGADIRTASHGRSQQVDVP